MGSNLFGDELPKTHLEEMMEFTFPIFYKDNNGGYYMYYNERGDHAMMWFKKGGNTQSYGNNFPENEPVESRVETMKIMYRRSVFTKISPEEFEEASDRYNKELNEFFQGSIIFSEAASETRPVPKMRENHGRG